VVFKFVEIQLKNTGSKCLKEKGILFRRGWWWEERKKWVASVKYRLFF